MPLPECVLNSIDNELSTLAESHNDEKPKDVETADSIRGAIVTGGRLLGFFFRVN